MPTEKIFKLTDKYMFLSFVSRMGFAFPKRVFSVMRIMRIVSGERIRRPELNNFL
jgi:hypothetical protein